MFVFWARISGRSPVRLSEASASQKAMIKFEASAATARGFASCDQVDCPRSLPDSFKITKISFNNMKNHKHYV